LATTGLATAVLVISEGGSGKGSREFIFSGKTEYYTTSPLLLSLAGDSGMTYDGG
jgi:hypothetical protein